MTLTTAHAGGEAYAVDLENDTLEVLFIGLSMFTPLYATSMHTFEGYLLPVPLHTAAEFRQHDVTSY